MKKILWVAIGFALGLTSFAQMLVDVTLDQNQFLPGESLPVEVHIHNRSGQTVRLGNSPDWLTFSVESKDGYIVSKNGEAPVLGGFDLDSAKVATKRVDLAPYFNISHAGRYEIVATVHVPAWETQFSNTPKAFDLIEGTRLWEQTFGVPSTNFGTLPEMRKFILQQANYLRRITLYLRLTDADETHVIRLFPVGPLLSFSRPDPQVDAQSNLHLLYQNGPHSFSYTVYTPDAQLLLRQTYAYGTMRPKLARDEKGYVFVAGGVRERALSDFPPPITSTNQSPTQP